MTVQRKDKRFVLAITGASGSGKTSLVNAVTGLLDDATTFFFDDYGATHQYPEDLAEWVKSGFDPHRWKNPQLLEDLRLLSHGTAVTPPGAKKTIHPASIIVMEEPFGRTREHMGALVDFVACIELPLEIALARRIVRALDGVIKNKTGEEYAEELQRHLNWYLKDSGRDLYYWVNKKAQEDCHIILDGRRPVSQLAQEVVDSVTRILKK